MIGAVHLRIIGSRGQDFACREATKALAAATAAARALMELANCCSVPSTAMQQLAYLRIYHSSTGPCGRTVKPARAS